MTFEELERRYYELRGKQAAGKLSDEEFLAEVERLSLQDSQGHVDDRCQDWQMVCLP